MHNVLQAVNQKFAGLWAGYAPGFYFQLSFSCRFFFFTNLGDANEKNTRGGVWFPIKGKLNKSGQK